MFSSVNRAWNHCRGLQNEAPQSMTLSRTRPPGRSATEGTFPQVKVTKQNHRTGRWDSHSWTTLLLAVTKGHVMAQGRGSGNGSLCCKVVETHLKTKTKTFFHETQLKSMEARGELCKFYVKAKTELVSWQRGKKRKHVKVPHFRLFSSCQWELTSSQSPEGCTKEALPSLHLRKLCKRHRSQHLKWWGTEDDYL